MHHTIVFSESQDPAGALVPVAGVPDQSVRVQGDDIIVPTGMDRLIGAIACVGTNAARAMLMSPSLRRVNPYEISPIEAALVAGDRDNNQIHPLSPIQLSPDEALNAHIQATPGAAEQSSVSVFLAGGGIDKVEGNIRMVRFAINTLITAGVWVNTAIQFVDELPTGAYRVVGAALVLPDAVVARWVPVGGQWRPGFPVSQAVNSRQDRRFRLGGLGEWFVFNQNNPPTLDIFASDTAVAADYFGVLDVIPPG